MKITKEQAKKITNLHIQASNIYKVGASYSLIEEVLNVLNIKHERYNNLDKGYYRLWRINGENVECDAE